MSPGRLGASAAALALAGCAPLPVDDGDVTRLPGIYHVDSYQLGCDEGELTPTEALFEADILRVTSLALPEQDLLVGYPCSTFWSCEDPALLELEWAFTDIEPDRARSERRSYTTDGLGCDLSWEEWTIERDGEQIRMTKTHYQALAFGSPSPEDCEAHLRTWDRERTCFYQEQLFGTRIR